MKLMAVRRESVDGLHGQLEADEYYNGFSIDIDTYCECGMVEDANCGIAFYIYQESTRDMLFTNNLLYGFGGEDEAIEEAKKAIDAWHAGEVETW